MIGTTRKTGPGAAALALSVTALCATVLTACGSGGDTPQDSATVALDAALTSLDPVAQNAAVQLYRSVFDQLTAIDARGDLQPLLATSWTSDPAARVWTVHLRDGARFSDGTPVTAADVAFSYQRILDDPTSVNRVLLASLASVAAPDPRTVVFTMASAAVTWPRQMSNFSVVPAAAYRADPAGFARHPVTSGPYAVSSFDPTTQTVRLQARADYWGGAPALRDVTVVSIADQGARANALQSGDADVATIAPTQRAAVEGGGATVEAVSGNKSVYLGFNETVPALADPAVRRAVSLAVDRRAITGSLLGSAAEPIAAPIAPAVVGNDAALAPAGPDLAQARALVAGSSYDGTPITFQYPTSGAVLQAPEVAQAVAGFLQQAGLTVRLVGMDNAAFVSAWTSKQLTGMYMYIFQPSTLDAATPANLLFGPSGYKYFSDPALTELAARQATTVDPARRAAVFTALWEGNARNAYYPGLYAEPYLYAWDAKRLAVVPRVDG